MAQDEKSYALHRFVESVVISGCIFAASLFILPWFAYFALGGCVAAVLTIKRQRNQYSILGLIVLFVMDTVLWPAMVWVDTTQQVNKT